MTVIGEENVPKDQAVLYIGNHRSYFDIIITYARCPRLTGYIAKKDMEKVPLLRTWMRRLHCLFIDRENVKRSVKNDPCRNRQCKEWNFHVYLPGRHKK